MIEIVTLYFIESSKYNTLKGKEFNLTYILKLQINDIFPLSPYINTHEMMMYPKKMSGSYAWTDCERHWAGVFNTSYETRNYTNNVYHIFENAILN